MGSLPRAVFFGTPAIAVPALRALCEVAEVTGVVSQPDRPAGRGMKLRAPAVKEAALELGVPVYQPVKVRDGSLQEWLATQRADVALVMAYGRILPQPVLDTPRLGCLNLHASLLPHYRGAAPIQRALMAGERETGVCLMQMDAGLDTGDVLSTHRLAIPPEMDAAGLAEALATLAATVTREDLPRRVRGELHPTPQAHEQATHAPPLTRADGALDPRQSAELLCHQIRGLAPKPGAFATLERGAEPPRTLKVLRAQALTDRGLAPGQLIVDGGRLLLGTGAGTLELFEAQLEGKRAMAARDLINGRTVTEGDRLVRPVLDDVTVTSS